MVNVLILLTLPERVTMQYCDRLREKFPDLNINTVDHHTKVGPYIRSANVLMTFGAMMSDHVLEQATNLRWIQALGTGVDGLLDRLSPESDVVLTNLRGMHGAPVSEAAIMAMLALSRDLPRAMRNQARHVWDRFPATLLKDKTVGILGIGAIAEELAPKCKAFGMTVLGISTASRDVAGVDRMYGRDALAQAAAEVDYLVALTPYSAATRGIVNAAIFAAMKPTSYFINIARGGVVDEPALIQALRDGRIAGAALDVFAVEPLPEDHPFWTMPNVIVTPHLGGFCDVYGNLALPVLEENMRRFLAGDIENMINIVKR